MPNPKITCNKLVSIPTARAWSQVYHAGNLVALLSLSYSSENANEEPLSAIGKELLTILEAEYFTIEEKNLHSIKKAVQEMIDTLPEYIQATIIVATVIDSILYIFLSGKGKVMLRRDSKVGVLLESQELAIESDTRQLLSASGYLYHTDKIILVSNPFFDVVPRKDLLFEIEKHTPVITVDNLEPTLHAKREGAAVCAIITYNGDNPVLAKQLPEPVVEEESIPAEEDTSPTLADEIAHSSKDTVTEQVSRPVLPKISVKLPTFSRRQIIFLSIACFILIIFVGMLMVSISRSRTAEISQFPLIYAQAETKYKEGMNLKTLNDSEAQEAFKKAKILLEENQNKYSEFSEDGKKLRELLSKINAELSGTPTVAENTTTKEVAEDSNEYLAIIKKHTDINYFAETKRTVLAADITGISSIDKDSGESEEIIKNDRDWSNIGGFGTYLGNIYLLDKKENQLLKFTPSGKEYGKSDYFTGDTPDLSKAVSLTIDGSIFILMNDGTIKKYTKGKENSFSISGLQKPLAKPTRIISTVEGDLLYILDKGNNRIVVLKKSGNFVAEYPAKIISKAKEITISEDEKTLLILSGNKVYEIEMK